MSKDRVTKVFKEVFRKNKTGLLIYVLETLVFLLVVFLYGEKTEAFVYGAILAGVAVLIILVVQFIIEYRRARIREHYVAAALTEWNNIPKADSLAEEDYGKIIAALGRKCEKLTYEYEENKRNTEDYYTAWVHQIKTPISVMRLKLTAEDSAANRELLNELFRIEQYVDMVLQYMRLESETNDLVIVEYTSDELIKASIRKYAAQFVLKKLKLEYEPAEVKIVTDKKWFGVIMDQLISNAIKYTQSGSVSIEVTDTRVTVSDTGIGIAAEDLPRIFEKGFTGNNGRLDKKSSGLGLYLAKRAARKLCLDVEADSIQGQGSKFSIIFKK